MNRVHGSVQHRQRTEHGWGAGSEDRGRTEMGLEPGVDGAFSRERREPSWVKGQRPPQQVPNNTRLGGVADTSECCAALQKDPDRLERGAEKNHLKFYKAQNRYILFAFGGKENVAILSWRQDEKFWVS
ncbi:hypothetical protein DUI87_07317 [Hirundo rustica rustica]|uniref:Uncharacterized protein n=1 Tax=Hirundo rustica rustica TaxID=333673 RepID=A0A3M0KPT4_HIRRU|nr:hypothetical protein DUI87_07317 [Hirundo rustica rustica]